MPSVFDALFVLHVFKKKTDLSNRSNWESPKFQQILDRSNHSIGEIDRTNLLLEAEEVLMDEMPIIPMFSTNKRFAKNPKLKGENISYLQFVDFKSAYFEP